MAVSSRGSKPWYSNSVRFLRYYAGPGTFASTVPVYQVLPAAELAVRPAVLVQNDW